MVQGKIILSVVVLFPIICGFITRLAGAKNEKGMRFFADMAVALELLLMLYIWISEGQTILAGSEEICTVLNICGLGLQFSMEGFRLVYGLVAAFMWLIAIFMSDEYMGHHDNKGRYYFYMLLTEGATMGVFLSENLYTTFIFFEIMSFTSYVWVAQEETAPALRAAQTYLAVAVTGGLVMLMGIFMAYWAFGTLDIDQLMSAAAAYDNNVLKTAIAVCLAFGFGAKAGAFPLHIWLPKAHPVAPAPASALLSGILTKSGVFGLIVVSCHIMWHDAMWGRFILLLGVITMFLGALLAVFSIDLKRTLACSSLSQIGFIMVGIGAYDLMEEEQFLAGHGAMLHMVNHSLIKLVLFTAAGVVYMNAHSLNLNEIRGFGRKKPVLMTCFLVGALAIGGIPLFGGYISKTLLHEALLLIHISAGWAKFAECIFLFSGGLTIAYMTKLFVAIFVEENIEPDKQKQYDGMKKYMNLKSTLSLCAAALVLFVWGIAPHVFMDKAAVMAEHFLELEESGQTIAYFSLENLKGAAISLTIGVLVYVFFVRKLLMQDGRNEAGRPVRDYVNLWPAWLDLEDILYRPMLLKVLPTVFGVACRITDSAIDVLVVLLRKTLYKDSPLPREPKRLSLKREEIREDWNIIQRSVSYGFLLCGIGVMITLIYIILL